MPTIDQLNAALLKADGNGDTQNAQIFANQIKQLRGNSPQPQGASPTPSPEAAASVAGETAGQAENGPEAALGQFARQYLPGSQYVGAGARYALQRLTGVKNPDTFATDKAYAEGQSQGEAEGHPVSATLGGAAGVVSQGLAGGAALSRAGRAIPVLGKALEVVGGRPGETIKNVAKGVALNSAIGGTEAATEGKSAPDVALDAAATGLTGGVGGAVAGKLTDYALSKLGDASQAAMRTFAKTIDETPADLESAINTHLQVTGTLPSTAQIVNLKSQGKIKQLANLNDNISDAAIKAANAAGAPLHEQIAAAQQQADFASQRTAAGQNLSNPIANGGGVPGQTPAAQQDFRDSYMDHIMAMPHPTTGVVLRDTPAPDPQGHLLDPHVGFALRPDTNMNMRLGQTGSTEPSELLQRLHDNQATVGDVDTVRKALRAQQAALMRPSTGTQAAANPTLAKEFGDIANKVEGIGTRADPDYGKALGVYRGLSNYQDAFEHGMTGKSTAEATDPMTAAALKTPMGLAGYEHGNAVKRGQDALNIIAPGSVKPQGGFGIGQATQAAMATNAGGGLNAFYHALKAVPGVSLPKAQQDIIAKQLFDPVTTLQGVKNLQRARMSAQQIQTMAASVGGEIGKRISGYLSPQASQ